MPDLRSLPRTRYGGIQTSSRPRIKYGVNSSREPSQRLGPGFHREPWIPAFAGMTTFLETVSLWTDTNYYFVPMNPDLSSGQGYLRVS